VTKIGVFCIARDEQDSLPVMWESCKPIADELIICDTGSIDGTVAYANTQTEHVLIHPRSEEWKSNQSLFNFAEARNYALQYIEEKTDIDWILILDCDETLDIESAKTLRANLEKIPDEVELALLTMIMEHDDGVPYQVFLAERLIRNKRNVRFDGAMHNTVNVPVAEDNGEPSKKRLPNIDIKLHHNRNVMNENTRQRRANQRLEMAEEVFLKRIEADPKDRRAMFYLAGTYYDCKEHDKALHWFERYLEISDWAEERYQASILMANILIGKKRLAEARTILGRYALIDNYRRAEAYLLLGQIAMIEKNTGEAEWWFKIASLKEMPIDPLFVEVSAHTWEPHFQLYQLYRSAGNIEQGMKHATEAFAQGAPIQSDMAKWVKNHMEQKEIKRILCLVDRGQMSFLQPIVDKWESEGKTVLISSSIEEAQGMLDETIDLVWCEWAGELSEWVSSINPKTCKIVIRVHGYETHTGILNRINWVNIDDVIFVAEYLKELAIEQVPSLEQMCNAYVVHGGVDVSKYSIGKNKQGNKIAMAAFGNYKKNFPMAIQILAELPDDYELHIATEWQDHRYEMYCKHIVSELNLGKRVFWYPWQTDLNKFYEDKDFYLSSSMEESFHYSLVEAMACGLQPIIHCWKSSEELFKHDWIFTRLSEAVCSIGMEKRIESTKIRKFIEKNLSFDSQMERIRRIIERPSIAVSDSGGQHQYSWATKLTQAAVNIGCRIDDKHPDLVIILGIEPKIEPWMGGATKVFWCCEQIAGNDEHAKTRRRQIKEIVPKVNIVFTHIATSVPILAGMGAKRIEVVSCVADAPPFRKLPNVEKKFDVGFSGFVNERRARILEELGKEFEITIFNSPDHEEVNKFYNLCRCVLNIHCTDEPNLETRIGEVVSSGTSLIPEDDIGVMAHNIRDCLDGMWEYQNEIDRLEHKRENKLEYRLEHILRTAGM